VTPEFGAKEWQGKPRGRYWIPKEFCRWDEVQRADLYALGVFVTHGIWGENQSVTRRLKRSVRRHGGDAATRLIELGLWRDDGDHYETRTMADLRLGRGSRGLVMVLSSRLDGGPEASKAGFGAIGLYALAASWSLNTDRPGVIPTDVAQQLGKPKLIARLWDSALWLVAERAFLMAAGPDPIHMLWGLARDDRRAPIPPELRLKVYERDGYRCLECGSAEDLTLDHVLPWSWGGLETEENLRTLCRSCNSSKGARA